MRNQIKFLLHDVAAALFGALLTLAFAPYKIFPFAIISMTGLLALWLDKTPKKACWLGFLFGLGLFGTGVNWIFISIHNVGQVSIFLAAFITASFVAVLSLYPAAVGYITNRFFPATTTAKLVCAFPAIWIFSEWVRSWLFTGFPWLFLGYSQTNSPLKGFASVLGVYGVSLAVLISSGLLLNTFLKYKQKDYRNTYLNMFIMLTIWISGSLLSLIPWTKANEKAIPIAMIQGNIPQSIKWSIDHLQLSLDTYENLTQPLWGKAKIIIWPEAAIPLSVQEATEFIEKLDEKARASGSTLIFGIPIQSPDGKGYYNSIVTLGENKQVYSKRQLVPFGEYTPLSAFFSRALSFMDIPMSNMVAGKFIQDPFSIGNVKILPSICYEIAYPDLIRTYDKTVSFLLTVTNDAWFGQSNAQAQHLQMAEMRAMEMGRSIVFVSNDGITAIIGPDGNIQASAPPHKTYVLEGKVQPMHGITPWMRNGSDPTLFLSICLLIYAVRSRKPKQQSIEKDTTLTQTL